MQREAGWSPQPLLNRPRGEDAASGAGPSRDRRLARPSRHCRFFLTNSEGRSAGGYRSPGDRAEPSRRPLACPPAQRRPAAVRPQADSAGPRLDARRPRSGRLLRRARGYVGLPPPTGPRTNSSGRPTERGLVVASCGDASFAASGSSWQEDQASRFFDNVGVDLVRALCLLTRGGAFAPGSTTCVTCVLGGSPGLRFGRAAEVESAGGASAQRKPERWTPARPAQA